jgi:flagellar hook assembly protein FlgD
MRTSAGLVYAIIVLSAFFAASPAWADGASVFINYPSISPDGDGSQDFMSIVVTLTGDVDSLVVTIEDLSSPVVYKTLLTSVPAAAGDHAAVWDGTDEGDALLPEGEYRLRVYESTGGTGQSLLRTVVIDMTGPQVAIDRIEPGVYAPGWPDDEAEVTVYFTVSEWETGATAWMTVVDPDEVSTVSSLSIDADGEWTASWQDAEAETGTYLVEVTVRDEAGNVDSDTGSFLVDATGPVTSFVTVIAANTREVPAEIVGHSHDPAGVAWLQLSWTGPTGGESDRFDADSTWLDGDTLYFRFDTPDTVTGEAGYVEGAYTLKAFARDPFENQTSKSLAFKLDRTAPGAPSIDAPPARVIESVLDLSVTWTTGSDSLHLYRSHDGATVRTSYLTAGLGSSNPPSVALGEGENLIWATASDKAGNTSAVSNTVAVVYDPSTQMTIPEAFRGPDRFQIVTDRSAARVEVTLYDMRGDLVRRLSLEGPASRFDIEWDLRTQDGEEVRNGAYLAVITVDFGSSRTVEKCFIAVVR